MFNILVDLIIGSGNLGLLGFFILGFLLFVENFGKLGNVGILKKNLEEFRNNFINEDIIAEATNSNQHEAEVFIDLAVDILKNDYSLITDMSHCYFKFDKGTKKYKNMQIDAAYLDLASNTINLLYVDFNRDETQNITNASK